MTEFRFAHPYILLLYLPAALLLARWLIGRRRAVQPVMRYSDTRVLSGLPTGLRVRLRRLPDALRLLAWLLLIAALARPQWGERIEQIRGDGIDIVLALDISSSMITPDFDPNRLEAAKQVMQEFVSGREFDRIGLVIFAEDAFYRAPLTLDYNLLLEQLESIVLAFELGIGESTAIGIGIASSANMLRESDSESRIIILLTDGANNAGDIDPITAADAARAFDIRIYTIGVGLPGAPVSADRRNSFDLDEPTLRRIAEITDGRYYNAQDLADLRDIYAEIDQLERSTFEREIQVIWVDQGFWLLGMALILLITERILRQTLFQTIP